MAKVQIKYENPIPFDVFFRLAGKSQALFSERKMLCYCEGIGYHVVSNNKLLLYEKTRYA